jgi:glutaredoxin
MYSTSFCAYCFLARRTLERHGIEYEELDKLKPKTAGGENDTP